MTPPRVLFLTDNKKATSSRFAALHQFNDRYEIFFQDRITASTRTIADFALMLIVAEKQNVMNAIESCRLLRSSTKVPILFVSPLDDVKTALAAYGAGADDYIVDSISIEHWNAKIQAWLRWTVTSAPPESEPKDEVRS